MMDFTGFVPLDNDLQREEYANTDGGTCGPSCIAANEGIKVQDVINRWRGLGFEAFRGFSPIAEIKETLTSFGYHFIYVRAHKAKTFPRPRTDTAILRIQWLDEDSKEYYWRAAGSHTHYVLMKRCEGRWWIFCNAEHWFLSDSIKAKNYLKGRGFVSSYLELSKQTENLQS